MRLFLITVMLFYSMTAVAHSIRFAGTWEGDAQYQFRRGTDSVSETHAVPLFVLDVGPHGELAGDSAQNGCTFIGRARPDGVQPSMTISVKLSDCEQAEYNGRYDGKFVYMKDDRRARVTLRMLPQSVDGDTVSAEITATVVPL